MTKIIAVVQDGDVTHLVAPMDMNIQEERGNWPIYIDGKYITFTNWLLNRGARIATPDEVMIIWLDD